MTDRLECFGSRQRDTRHDTRRRLPLGDLVATCSSPLSRNRRFGEELGKGRTVAEITASTRQVAEGVKSCASINELAAKHQIEMPIVEAVAAVIAGELTPAEMITTLMSRSAKPERY